MTIPVAVGAIILGPVGGLICGLTFGLTSLYQAVTGGSVFTFALFNISPVFTIILTVVPRTLEGLLTGLIFKVLHNIRSVQKVSYYIASLACPLLNTLLFMSTLVALFYRTDFIQTYVTKFAASNPFTFDHHIGYGTQTKGSSYPEGKWSRIETDYFIVCPPLYKTADCFRNYCISINLYSHTNIRRTCVIMAG